MTSPPLDYAKLREIAEKATTGPWFQSGMPWYSSRSAILAGSPDPHVGRIIADTETWEGEWDELIENGVQLATADDDARHIATFDPPTVLALLAENERMAEALRDAEETLALVEQPRSEDSYYGDEVEALGRRIGFGALMTSAQASWRKHTIVPGGEFVAGPCFATVIATLKTIRQALPPTPSDHVESGGEM